MCRLSEPEAFDPENGTVDARPTFSFFLGPRRGDPMFEAEKERRLKVRQASREMELDASSSTPGHI